MTPAELEAKCREQQALLGRTNVEIVLLQARPRRGTSTHRRLGRGGPSGRIVGWHGIDVAVMYRVDEVLAWLERRREGQSG